MSFKRKLIFVLSFLLLVSLAFGSAIYVSLANYTTAIEKSNVADEIVHSIVERRQVADDYIYTRVDRAKSQWFTKQESIKELVSTNEDLFLEEEDHEFLVNVQKGLDESEEIFKNIVNTTEQLNSEENQSIVSQRENSISQLSVKAQESVSIASNLSHKSKDEAATYLDQIVLLFSTAASLFFGMLIISFWIIWRGARQLEKSSKELAQSNERFQFVSRATNDVIYDWNIASGSLWFSDAFQKLFGYKKEDIHYTLDWWSSLIHTEDKDRIDKQINDIIQSTDDSITLEYKFKRNDGTYAYILDRAYLTRDSEGKAVRYIGVMQDVTTNKKYEEDLQARTHEAERLNKITIDRELKMIELKKELAKYTSKKQETI